MADEHGLIASVLMCVYNVEKDIRKSIDSILSQTVKDFELVVVDDASTDGTRRIIESFADKRISYFRNDLNLGIQKSRNKTLKLAKSELVFFTDGDCAVSEDWIEQGLKCLEKEGIVGVEGRTYYISKDYKHSFSDRIIKNDKPGQYMTCNMAYKKSVIERIGGFDERHTYMGDRDAALKAMKFGRIDFNADMVVYHQKRTFTPKQFVQTGGSRIRNRVLLYKRYGKRSDARVAWKVFYPRNLLLILFPPLVFGSFFRQRYKTKEDFALFPYIYVRVIFERLNIWDMCAKERVFLI